MSQDGTRADPTEPNASETDSRSYRRRKFLAATGISLAGLAGCMGGDDTGNPEPTATPTDASGTTTGEPTPSKPFKGQEITLAVWSGQDGKVWKEHLKPMFEEKTGATMKISTVWSEILPKIKSAPKDDPPFDVTVGDGYVSYYGRQSDLFEKIRYDNVPNFENVYPFLKEFRPHDYGVPIEGMPMSLVYRTDQEFKPRTWSDFGTQEGLNTKIAMEGSWHAYPSHIAAIAADDLEMAGEMYKKDYHKVPFETLSNWNVQKWYGGGAEFWESLRNGVVSAAQYYYSAYTQFKEEDPLAFHHPPRSVSYYDHYHVVRGTQVRDLAEWLVNWMAGPELQEAWVKHEPLMLSNTNSKYPNGQLRADFPTTDAQWNSVAFFDVPYLINHYKTFSDYFKQVKTGSFGG